MTFRIIEHLIIKYPNLEWDFDSLSYNTELSEWIINKTIDKKWNWDKLSHNKNISFKFIEKYINKNWNFYILTKRQDITLEFIEKNITKYWDFEYIAEYIADINFIEKYLIHKDLFGMLSKNTNINIDFVIKYDKRSWDWFSLLKNKKITLDFCLMMAQKSNDKIWQHLWNLENPDRNIKYIMRNYLNQNNIWYIFSKIPNINIQDIENNINEPWDWSYSLSKNENIPISFIKKHKDKPWDYYCITANTNLNLNFIEELILQYPDIKLNWYFISRNKNITSDFIKKYNTKPWCWYSLAYNDNATFELISEYIDKNWDWIYILYNKNIPEWFIDKHFNDCLFKSYTWSHFSKNPYLTLQIILKYKDQSWDYDYLIYNSHLYYYFINFKSNIDWIRLSKNNYLSLDFIESNIENISIYNLCFNKLKNNIDENLKNTMFNKYKQELLDTSWHPDRFFDWCLDNDDIISLKNFNQ